MAAAAWGCVPHDLLRLGCKLCGAVSGRVGRPDPAACGWDRGCAQHQQAPNAAALPKTTPRPQSSEAYRDLDNIGTTYLANKLSNHLVGEITRKLPDIQSYIDKT